MRQYRRPLIVWFGVIIAISLIFIMLPALSAQAAELKLPSGLKRIEAQAFYGDTSLDAVTVQEGTEVIGSKAFARSSVRTVSLPASLYSIADDAFDGCENLTVNAQEGTYAYTWAVKKELIKINGGAAGAETKVIAPDTLRAGADLMVQIIGPADTIQHSVYIVNEQTGEYQSAQLNKARENVTFSGYNFDSGSTYRLTVYTVTRQYQMLTPVNKIIQVTGQKPTVPVIDLPDTMKASQNIEIRSDIDDEILLTANCYSTEGELISTYERTSYYGRFDLNSWSFYDKYEDGGTIQVKYAVHYGELWSEWSETKTIIVTPLQFGVNVIGFPDTVENGQDFGVGFEYEGYVDYCDYTVRLEDSDDITPSITSGECQLGNDGGAGTVQIETQNLDKGRYIFTMYFYADGASKTVYQKTFEVVGERTNPPDVTAEQTTVYVDSYTYFMVDTEKADKIAVHVEYPKGWGGTDNYKENAYDRTYRWEHWFYNEGEFELRFAVRREGRWSAWSDPIEVLAKRKQKLASPSIHAESAIAAGQDLTFSFDEVENATFYNAGLQTTYSDNNLYLIEPATPSDLQEIPGYMLSSGNYVLEVNAGAEGYYASSQKKYVTVNGTKPSGPEVSVEKEPQYANQNVVFSINTQNAEALQARYQISNDYSNGSYQYASIPVSGATTQWSFTIPRYWQGWECKKLTVGFSTKSNGVWSAWKTQMYDIDGLMPLSQAIIHVDDEIQARTEFSIKIDPVENATQYEIRIINPYGSIILHDHRSILEEISLNSRFYDQGEYTIKVWAYSNNYASSLSEKTFTIAGLPPLDPVAIHVDDTIEAGKDFSITLDPVANATRYEYGLYQGDECVRWYDSYSAVGLLRIYGYELETGSCTMKVWAYSEDYTTSYSEKAFTVIGSKQSAPEVSVDKNNVFQDEYFTFTIDTKYADALVYKKVSSYGNFYSPNSISVQGETTQWSTYGNLGIWSYTFTVLKNGIWSEWSAPITINTSEKPVLAEPVVHASETVIAGNDYTFSFDAVEHATSYGVSIKSAYGGDTLYSWEEALSDTEMVVPGYILNGGSYVVNVSAYAAGYTSSAKTIYITVSGQKPAGPDITVEEPLRIKRKAVFSVDTEGAEALRVKYQYTAPNNWWSEQQISVPVTGDITTWEHSIDEYKQGVNLIVSFAAKVDGVWSAWRTKTYTIEGLPPLDPAVIHVDDTVEAGKDFSITVDPVENASRYDFGIYKSDGWSTGVDGESTIGAETFSGSHFEPGDYTIKVRAYSSDYSSSTSEKAFTITGTKPTAPTVSVNKQDVKVREYYVFTINTENADALRYREYGNIYDINVLEDETQWSTYSYNAGNYEYSFAVRRNGVWSAWSEPITINVTNYDPLPAPEISVTSPLESRRDLVVSLSKVEDATSYRIYLSKTDGTLSFSQTVYPQDTVTYTFPGYRITPGTYDISAYASNSNVNSPAARKTITIAETDGLPAPTVTPPENTTVASGSYVSFVIDSSETDTIAVRYFTPGNTNEISYSTKAAQEGQDETSWSLYFSGSARKYSFAVRKDGVWSEWSEFITISSIQ